MSEAEQIRCGACGASYPIPVHGAVLRCPYCGQTQVGGAGALRDAQAYGSAVGVIASMARQDDAAREEEIAWRVHQHRHRVAMLAFAAMLATGLFTGAVYGFVPQADRDGALAGVLGLGAALLLASIVYGFKTPGGLAALTPLEGRLAVVCPNCGAPGEMQVGDVTQRCGHCREHLIPSRPLIEAGLTQAQLARRQAALRLGQEERANDPAAHESFVAEYELAITVGLVMLLQIGVGVSMGQSGDVTTAIALIGAAVVIIGLPLAIHLVGRSRIKPVRAPVRALAAQLAGVVVDRDDAIGAWLDQHWPAPFSLKDLRRASYLGVVARVHGYPSLLLVQAVGKRSKRRYATVILLAGDAAQPNANTPAAQHEAAVIAQAGFDAQVTEAGVTLTTRPEHARELYRQPPQLLQAATVAGHGARLAAAAGSAPVG